jgi:hypothetical protein
MAKYKLDVQSDVDDDGGEGFVLNLRYGFRFSDDIVHVRGYDTMKELRESVKNDVIPCDCLDCKRGLQKIRIAKRLGMA